MTSGWLQRDSVISMINNRLLSSNSAGLGEYWLYYYWSVWFIKLNLSSLMKQLQSFLLVCIIVCLCSILRWWCSLWSKSVLGMRFCNNRVCVRLKKIKSEQIYATRFLDVSTDCTVLPSIRKQSLLAEQPIDTCTLMMRNNCRTNGTIYLSSQVK